MKPSEFGVVFHVANIEKSVEFYRKHLGFEVGFEFGDPVTYVGLFCGMVNLHISSSYPYKNNTGHGHLYLVYDEVDGLYTNLKNGGVEFYSLIADREYGMRDFAVKDPDDNHIGIGANLFIGG